MHTQFYHYNIFISFGTMKILLEEKKEANDLETFYQMKTSDVLTR